MRKNRPLVLPPHQPTQKIRRYVDDIYLQTTNEEKGNEFHSTMNFLHPRLKFEIEKPATSPEGLSLSLVEFKVTISADGKSSFLYYNKSAKKPPFVHHQSALPRNSKFNFIRNERKRIQQKCSTETTFDKHNRNFHDMLRLNGYPEDATDESERPQNHP